MRIGINGSAHVAMNAPTATLVEHARQAEADGFPSWWVAQVGGLDALTALAVIGQATATIELGTAVVATFPRHPMALAGQAITTSELTGGRLVLGIGLAHKPTIEESLRIPFERPARHMQDYLDVLQPLLESRAVDHTGEIWSGCTEAFGGPPAPTPSVMLAAMGPRMLELAGSRTDGSILWLSGPRTVAERIKPALDAAAERAGRPSPRIVASVPVCVTDDPQPVRDLIGVVLAGYNDLPSYRDVMDLEGVAGPADVSIVGDEDHVRERLAAYAEAGTTDFAAVEFPADPDSADRTRALLKDLAAAG